MNKLILQAHDLFKNCDFPYFICGGFALDMFAGKELRPHGDFDISVFKENKRDVVKFLQDNGWPVYARFFDPDKPETMKDFYLIGDPNDSMLDDCLNMWAVKPGSFADMRLKEGAEGIYTYKIIEPRLQGFDFIELSFNTQANNCFVYDEDPSITLELDRAILYKDNVPYMAPELVLFLKSHPFYSEHEYQIPKTTFDFKAVMPLLPEKSRQWLMDALDKAWPDGYSWLEGLLI